MVSTESEYENQMIVRMILFRLWKTDELRVSHSKVILFQISPDTFPWVGLNQVLNNTSLWHSFPWDPDRPLILFSFTQNKKSLFFRVIVVFQSPITRVGYLLRLLKEILPNHFLVWGASADTFIYFVFIYSNFGFWR